MRRAKVLVPVVIVVVALAAYGAYAVLPSLTCSPTPRPWVGLAFVHLRLHNITEGVPYVGGALAVSFEAEVVVRNEGGEVVRLREVRLCLPEALAYVTGGPSTYTVTAVTAAPPGGGASGGEVSGPLNDVLYYTKVLPDEEAYVIPPGHELRLVISGEALLPEEDYGRFVERWLHGGEWAYFVVWASVEGCGGVAKNSATIKADLSTVGPGDYYYESGIEPELIGYQIGYPVTVTVHPIRE